MHGYLVELCDMLFAKNSTIQIDLLHHQAVSLGLYHSLMDAVYSSSDRLNDFDIALAASPFGSVMTTLFQSEGFSTLKATFTDVISPVCFAQASLNRLPE